MMRNFSCGLVVLFVAAGALHAGQNVRRANSVERIVRYDYAVTNVSDRAQDITVYLSLPQANPRQEVLFLYPEPGHQRMVQDAYGNCIAIYVDRAVPPGEVRRHGWMAAARTYAAVWQPSRPEPLGEDDRLLYTRDSSNYQINSPIIQSLRDSLIRPEMSDVDIASAFFGYFVHNVTYFRDDKWDAAPQVIERKQGSCSEYTYSYLSLLRSSGIPCRYTGGVMISTGNRSRYDEKVHEDAVFHRWAEVFLKDYGWFPVDGSRAAGATRRFGNYLNFWGQLTADCLQTYCGDGGDDSLLGWDYVANATGQGRNTVKHDGVCYWVEAPLDRLQPTVVDVEKAFERKMPPQRLAELVKDTLSREVLFLLQNRLERSSYPALAEELLKVRHPSAIYFAVYCDQHGVALPPFMEFPLLVDEYLRAEIIKHRSAGRWDWRAFERWWRKARPEITYSDPRKVFVLNNRNIDLN